MSEEILNKLLEFAVEAKGEFGKINQRFDKIEVRLDRIEGKLDVIESEVGTMKDALLDVSRTVKEHDHAIREIKERYH